MDTPLRQCLLEIDGCIASTEQAQEQVVILVSRQGLVEAANRVEGRSRDERGRRQHEHVVPQALPQVALGVRGSAQPQTGARAHAAVFLDLVEIGITPPQIPLRRAQERSAQLLQMLGIPDIVLVQQRDMGSA